MKLVVESLELAGHNAYCSIFDSHKIKLQEHAATKEIFQYAFQNIAKCDGMVAIITSNRKSEGQLMEIGATLAANKPLYLFMHESTKDTPSHLQKVATEVFVYSTDQDLANQLTNLA